MSPEFLISFLWVFIGTTIGAYTIYESWKDARHVYSSFLDFSAALALSVILFLGTIIIWPLMVPTYLLYRLLKEKFYD